MHKYKKILIIFNRDTVGRCRNRQSRDSKPGISQINYKYNKILQSKY